MDDDTEVYLNWLTLDNKEFVVAELTTANMSQAYLSPCVSNVVQLPLIETTVEYMVGYILTKNHPFIERRAEPSTIRARLLVSDD